MRDVHVKGWLRESHLPPEMLDSVRSLNYQFLDLLATQPADWSAAARGLPTAVFTQVAPLSTAQKAAVAGCPYALFDLRFHDANHWRLRFRAAAAAGIADAAPTAVGALEFTRLALFFAWHVAATARLAAPLLLGMHEETIEAFRGAPIECLPSLAVAEAAHLSARWNHRTTYWRALAGAASKANATDLRRVQLFGLQLAAAARLDGAGAPRLAASGLAASGLD